MTAPAGPAGPVPVGVIGAGNVSDQYLPSLLSYPDIEVRGIADLDVSRARAQAAKYDLSFAGTAEELLAIGDIELVLNLTTPAAHTEVALADFEQGLARLETRQVFGKVIVNF